MSDLHFLPPELPPRPARVVPMAVQRVISARSGFEHWTLRCTKCGHIDEAQVHVDPMNSYALGWLRGELGQPG